MARNEGDFKGSWRASLFHFLDVESGQLFAYLEVDDVETWDKVSETEICKKWWDYMEPLMETNPDNSPVSKQLQSVFYLE